MVRLLITAFCLLVFSGICQSSFQWAAKMGGTGTDSPTGIVTDIQGDVYIAGNFHGTSDFDPGSGTANLISAGNTDIFISKLSTTGNYLWAKQLGSTGLDSCFAICNDAMGNVLVSGWFSGTVDFDPGAGVHNLSTTSTTVFNTFILKLDGNGNFLWCKQIGNPMANLSELRSICCDSLGNVIATGKFSGTGLYKCDFDPGPSTFTLSPSGGLLAFVLKLDANGNFVWAVNFGGQIAQNAVCTDAAGGIYCGGAFAFTTDFDPGPGTYAMSNGGAVGAFGDGFILKLDVNGIFVWAKQLAGDDKEVVTCLKVDCQNNLICGGHFTSNFKPNGYGAGPVYLTEGAEDIFICKFSSTGTLIWCGQIGGKASELLRGLAGDNSGDIYLTGLFCGLTSVTSYTADFDPTAGASILNSTAGNDAFYCKLDAVGNLLWARGLGAQGMDSGWGIHLSNAFSVYVTGSFMMTTDFDPFTPINNLTSAGSNDCFVIKLAQSSTLVPSAVGDVTICSGENAVLTATSVGLVNWYNTITSTVSLGSGNNFSTPAIFANTVYFATSGQDCGGKNIYIPVNITVSDCVGTNEYFPTDPQFFIYPNPATFEVFITTKSRHHILIYDQLNRVVKDFYSEEKDSVTQLRNLTPGMYYISADDIGKAVKLVVSN